MKKYAVIVAGGTGNRMGSALPKQFLMIAGKTVLEYSIKAFLNAYDDMKIIVVLHKDHFETGSEIIKSLDATDRVTITGGGDTRFHSVQNGLNKISQHSIVFIHDAVRCLVSKDLIYCCYEGVMKNGNAVPAVQAVDTIRIVSSSGHEQIDRNRVRIIQTPQTFYSDIIKAAYQQEYDELFTDDASVAERMGVKINLIEGDNSNIKITRPVDLLIAEKLLQERSGSKR